MNLGQTMITMGMFVLLIMSVISANRMLVENAESGFETIALSESAIIANDLFQEAQGKLFDHLIDVVTYPDGDQPPSLFSSPTGGSPSTSEWGPSNAERTAVGSLPDSSYLGKYRSIDAYDDVDDYNGYTRIVNADTSNGVRLVGFKVTVRVFYVNPPDLDVEVNSQTIVKRIEVNVTNKKYFPENIREIGITYSSLMSD